MPLDPRASTDTARAKRPRDSEPDGGGGVFTLASMADIERHSIDVEHSDDTEQHKNRATATGGKYKAMDDTTDEDDAKRPLRSNSFSETVLDVVANIRSQKLSVKCDWNFRDATHTEQIVLACLPSAPRAPAAPCLAFVRVRVRRKSVAPGHVR